MSRSLKFAFLAICVIALTHRVQGMYVPDDYDLRSYYPDCFHDIPYEGMCVSSWALVMADSLSARYCMLDKESYGDVPLAAQTLISCLKNPNGCYDFTLEPTAVIKYLVDTGVPNSECQPFESGYRGQTPDCSSSCVSSNSEMKRYKADSKSGSIDTNENISSIQLELAANGPIVIQLSRSSSLTGYQSGEILKVSKNSSSSNGQDFGNVFAKIVGWGTDASTKEKYWIAQTAFGLVYGDESYMNIPFENNGNYQFYRLHPITNA